MKVSLEGTPTEFEQLAETLAWGKAYRAELNSRKDLQAKVMQDLQAGDDVPNRFREEGA